MEGRKKVVIVGGGIAGSLLAKTIQFNADLTLIDPKEYLEITWASLRSMMEPSFADRSVINHTEYLTNGRVVTSAAINITDTDVLTADGHRISYDYLVIATGHVDPFPVTKAERLRQYDAGGPCGVELAAEIATDFPRKKVTLVHKGPRLLEFIGKKASNKSLSWLRSRNVEVKLEQAIDLDTTLDESRVCRTSTGESLEADCRFLCVGKPLATAWLSETILKTNLDENRRLMVDEHLRVKGRSNIFAIGDITDVPEIKQGYLAQRHAMLVAKTLKLLMAGGKESKMSKYVPGLPIAMISLGRKNGVAQFPFATLSGRIPGWLKSGDLFVTTTRKQMGLKP